MVKKHLAASVIAGLTVAALSFGTTNAEPLKDKNKNDNDRKTVSRYKYKDTEKAYKKDFKHEKTKWTNGHNGKNSVNHAVPEPGTLVLIGSALGGIALASRGFNKEG